MKILLKNCKLIQGLSNIIIKNDKIIDVKPSERSQTFGTVETQYRQKKGTASSVGRVNFGMVDSFNQIIDIKNKLVIPGMIDAHVHVRDLQQCDKEDWKSASKAALAGGVTTIFDMPNTIPATTNLKGLNAKREAAQKALINYKFFVGATNSNLKDIEEILSENPSDIAGIKVFLAGSSNNDTITDKDILKNIFRVAKKYEKIVTVHTELQICLNEWKKKVPNYSILNHNEIRNRECSIMGTKLVLELAEEIGNKICIAHCSTAEELKLIRKFKMNNSVYCEITPHHLLLNETILEKVGNFGKVNPPLRCEKDNSALLEAVYDGTVDFIGTDHAPHKLFERQKEYQQTPSGFPGLETGLHLLLNEVNKENLTIIKLVELTSRNPAEIFNLEKRGEIKVGNFADLTVIDLNKKWKIDASKFNSKAKYSPFDGMKVQGKVVMCFVNGKKC